MTRSALSVCTLAAIAMAGCTTYYDPPPTPVTTTSGSPVSSATSVPAAAAPAAGSSSSAYPTTVAPAYRSGPGLIESISLVTLPASAAAGGTAAPVSGPYRVTLRMDDGSSQTLMIDNRAFLVGDRVQIQDGRMVRP